MRYTKIILLQILAIWIWYYIGRISKVKGMKELSLAMVIINVISIYVNVLKMYR